MGTDMVQRENSAARESGGGAGRGGGGKRGREVGKGRRGGRRFWRWVGGLSLGLMVLVGVGVVLLPTVVGWVAPGVIVSSFNDRFEGELLVGSVSVGWGRGVEVRGVRLRAAGEGGDVVVGSLVLPEVGVGRVLRERWWRAFDGGGSGVGGEIDVGVVRFDGSVSLARGVDGVWNFERALQERGGVVVGGGGGASGGGTGGGVGGVGGLGGWKFLGRFEAGGIVSVRDALGGSGGGVGFGVSDVGDVLLMGLDGGVLFDGFVVGVDVVVDFGGFADRGGWELRPGVLVGSGGRSGFVGVSVEGEVAGQARMLAAGEGGGAGGSGGGGWVGWGERSSLKFGLIGLVDPADVLGGVGSFELVCGGLPMGLVDVVGGFGGELVSSTDLFGEVVVRGSVGGGDVGVGSGGFTGDFSLRAAAGDAVVDVDLFLSDGVLRSVDGCRVVLPTVGFVGGIAGLADALAEAGAWGRLDGAPGVEVVLSRGFRVGLDVDGMLERGGFSVDDVRLGDAVVELTARIDGVRGDVRLGGDTDGGGGGVWSSFATDALVLSLSSMEGGVGDGGLVLRGGTSAVVDGRDAGEVRVEGVLRGIDGGLLGGLGDKSGGVGGVGGMGGVGGVGGLGGLGGLGVEIDVVAEGVATGLLRPVLAGMGYGRLDVERDVGERASVRVRAARGVVERGEVGAGLGEVVVSGSVEAEHLSAVVRGVLRGDGWVGDGESVVVRVGRGSRLAAAFSDPSVIRYGGWGVVDVTGRDVFVPMSLGGGDDVGVVGEGALLDGVRGRWQLRLRDGSVMLMSEGMRDVGLVAARDVTVDVVLGGDEEGGKGDGLSVLVGGTLGHQGRGFRVDGDVRVGSVGGLLRGLDGGLAGGVGGASELLGGSGFVGSLRFVDVPRSLARVSPAASRWVGLDVDAVWEDEVSAAVGGLVSSVVGDRGRVDVRFGPRGGGVGGLDVGGSVVLGLASCEVSVGVGGDVLVVERLVLACSGPRDGVNRVLGALGVGGDGDVGGGEGLRIGGDVGLVLSLGGPVVVPMGDDGMPDVGGVIGDVVLDFESRGDVVVDGVVLGGEARRLAARGLRGRVSGEVGGLVRGDGDVRGELGLVVARVDGGVGRGVGVGRVLGDVALNGVYGLGDGGIVGGYRVEVSDTGAWDGLVVVGDGVGLGAVVGPRALVSGSGRVVGDGVVEVVCGVESERLNVGPGRVVLDGGVARVADELVVRWRQDAGVVDGLLFGGEDDAGDRARVVGVSEVVGRVRSLSLWVGGGGDEGASEGYGLLRPDVFALDVGFGVDSLSVLTGGGAGGGVVTLRGVEGGVRRVVGGVGVGGGGGGVGGGGVDVGYEVVVGSSVGAVGGGAGAGGRSEVRGVVRGVADGRGELTFGGARVDADADVRGIPTALVDALAGQGGLLVDLLGPSVEVRARARSFGADGGSLSANGVSARASADVAGTVSEGDRVFAATSVVDVRLTEISRDLFSRLTAGVPLVSVMEKRAEDGPAVVRVEGLKYPLDGDLSKLNGVVKVDLGRVRFETTGLVQGLLKATGQRTAGEVGRRVQPFEVRLVNGVATYERYSLPLGEFEASTRGSVDLVNRRIDIVLYLPFGSLADETAGALNTGLGRALGRLPIVDSLTTVPIRIRGPLDNPSASPDVDLFVREQGDALLRLPARILDDVIGGGLRDLLEGIGGGRRRGEEPK